MIHFDRILMPLNFKKILEYFKVVSVLLAAFNFLFSLKFTANKSQQESYFGEFPNSKEFQKLEGAHIKAGLSSIHPAIYFCESYSFQAL